MNPIKTNRWAIELHAEGIKKRERKVKNHRFLLFTIPDEGKNPIIGEGTEKLAKDYLGDEMRTVIKACIVCVPEEITDYGNGHVMCARSLFNSRQFGHEVKL